MMDGWVIAKALVDCSGTSGIDGGAFLVIGEVLGLFECILSNLEFDENTPYHCPFLVHIRSFPGPDRTFLDNCVC